MEKRSDSSYKNLMAWKKSMEVVVAVYALTETFPKEEMYGLTSQIKRAAVSIPSNIAEGYRRRAVKDRQRFYCIAFASGAELETQIEISKQLGFCSQKSFSKADALLDEVMRLLNKMSS